MGEDGIDMRLERRCNACGDSILYHRITGEMLATEVSSPAHCPSRTTKMMKGFGRKPPGLSDVTRQRTDGLQVNVSKGEAECLAHI